MCLNLMCFCFLNLGHMKDKFGKIVQVEVLECPE